MVPTSVSSMVHLESGHQKEAAQMGTARCIEKSFSSLFKSSAAAICVPCLAAVPVAQEQSVMDSLASRLV